MPYKRKRTSSKSKSRKYSKKSNGSKRTYSKRRRWQPRAKKTRTINYIAGVQADNTKVKLKWRLGGNFTIAASGAYQLVFTGNSPYDPDFVGTGPSAYLWSHMSELYSNYMCTYSKIKFHLYCGATVQNVDNCWIKKSSIQPIPATPNEFYGQPYGRVKRFYFNALSEQKPIVFTDKCSTTKMLGRKLDPSTDRVPIANDPFETWEYLFLMNNNLAVAKGFYWDCEMTFWVEFSNRKTLTV